MLKAIKDYLPIAKAIQKLFHPYVEVVVHDITTNKIVAIYNAFSKRQPGDPSLLSIEEEITSLQDCVGPYEKINWDGKKLKSVSSIIRDVKGTAVGLVCINLDISMAIHFQEMITKFLDYQHMIRQPDPLFKDDWQERVNQYVHQYLKVNHLSLDNLNREQKKAVIEELNQRGAFTGKNATKYVAQILKISRATVYNYLAETATI